MMDIERLRADPLFADLSAERLEWLRGNMTPLDLAAGEYLMRQGDKSTAFLVLAEGEIQVTRLSEGHEVLLGRQQPPSFFGEIGLLADTVAPVALRAGRPSRLWRVSPEVFRELLICCPTFSRGIFRTLEVRHKGLEGMVRQREKMAALGTLAAGLAHELNNPAAAVARAVDRMRALFAQVQRATGELGAAPADAAALELLRAAAQAAAPPAGIGALALSGREEAIGEWLAAQQVAEPWTLAPILAAAGFERDGLAALQAGLPAGALAPGMAWLAATLEADSVLDEAERGAARLSTLVKAMKSYAHLDQGPVQQVDVHDGIEDTLVILQHKLKQGIEIVREYDRSLPPIDAYGSELNQVWTNLIDNAVDAMAGRGRITLRTRRDGDYVEVEVGDTGPGVPAELQTRIFEPFFTTKPVGKGTGMGLEIAYRVVTYRHSGQIGVTSRPGETRFTIRLPVRAPFRPEDA